MATPQTFGDFQDYVKNLEQGRGFAGDSVLQKCLLLGEEVGELFKSVRKTAGVGVGPAAQASENPAHEMADILIILATIANRLDIDLGGHPFQGRNQREASVGLNPTGISGFRAIRPVLASAAGE